jgi:uncharacterized small protein (DUF1192 family)
MITGIQVSGLAQLQKDLVLLGVKIDDLKDVMARLAQEGARLAASLAPRKTGRLAESVRGNRAKNAAIVRAGSARIVYAGPINYGWPKRNIEPAGFMQRALDLMKPHVGADLERAINKLIAEKGL